MRPFYLLILLVLTQISCAKKQNSETENRLLKPKDFQEKLAASPGAVLLDVRTQDELIKDGLIKGALNFDFKTPEFKILITGMDKTKPYFVYCASGVRSGKTSEMLGELGFKEVYTLDGGLNAWKAEGLPVKTFPAP
jgi:rhodanese-related sulfurtransferase